MSSATYGSKPPLRSVYLRQKPGSRELGWTAKANRVGWGRREYRRTLDCVISVAWVPESKPGNEGGTPSQGLSGSLNNEDIVASEEGDVGERQNNLPTVVEHYSSQRIAEGIQ